MRWALYVTISPAWFDPGAGGSRWAVTPFWFCYALHDALVKPMPGQPHGSQSGGVLDGERRPAGVRI